MNREGLIDLDNHMRILNFLIYLQSIDVLSETKRIDCSNYIQDYLNERNKSVDILKKCLNLMKNDCYDE